MEITPTQNVVAYFRVSTDQQAASGLGLEAQRAAVRAYAAKNNLHIVSEHTDEGVSGKLGISDRPGLGCALQSMMTEGAQGLLVHKLDRLSRDLLTQLTIERTVEKSGARILSASGEGTLADDPSTVFTRRVLQAAAEMEAGVISARTKCALAAKKARGERVGRPAFGTRLNKKTMEIEATRDLEVVINVCELRSWGHGLQSIADELELSLNKVGRICRRWMVKDEGRYLLTPELYKLWKSPSSAYVRDGSPNNHNRILEMTIHP